MFLNNHVCNLLLLILFQERQILVSQVSKHSSRLGLAVILHKIGLESEESYILVDILVYQNQNLRMFEFTMRNSIFGQALFGVT
jgi:hypothetical protein